MLCAVMRNGFSICFQCQGENLSELAVSRLAWDGELNEQPQMGSVAGNAGTAWTIQAVVGIGRQGRETWLSRHVTSGLQEPH